MEPEVVPTLQRAVDKPRPPRYRWVIAAVALSTASTLIAGGAALATMLVRVPDAPAPQIQLVEVHRYHRWVPPVSSCNVPHVQLAVYRLDRPPQHMVVDGATGLVTRSTCITTPHGERTVVRTTGPDRQLDTVDDVCTTHVGCPPR